MALNSGHHALRYELTTMKSSTRGRRSLRDIRQKVPPINDVTNFHDFLTAPFPHFITFLNPMVV